MTPRLVDFNSKIETYVACTDEMRDAHIQYSTSQFDQRISQGFDRATDRVAVVCFGPSLQDTWPQIKNYSYVISCSGSHAFLLDRGIVPTWHVEVDARPHKVKLMGKPHSDVEYLIASSCHPKLIDHLNGYKVKLWHTYNNEDMSILPAVYPRGEWVFNGGSNVGLRAMILARFMGFRFLDVFGMDYSYPAGHQGEHVAAHPNPSAEKDRVTTVYDNVEYHTTASMMHYAREFFKECSLMPECKFTVYGTGLLQHMVHNRYTAPNGTPLHSASVLALASPQVITNKYRELNQQLHRENPYYGISGHLRANTVTGLATQLGTQDILDYGCGKGTLSQSMPWPIKEYDPAVLGKEQEPMPADIVVCTDVLEHVEPELLDHVLMDIGRCTRKLAYIVVHTGPSMKTLPDGRNTHLIQQPRAWWRQQLEKFFVIDDSYENGFEVHFVVKRQGEGSINLADLAQSAVIGSVLENHGIKIINCGGMTEWRSRTMLTKEPITIEWLDSIREHDVLVDVGANIGIYSLYAACKRFCTVYAFEPESQNYASLNYNINLNRCQSLLKAYCLSVSNKISLGVLNLSEMIPGNSCHQFNRELDHRNKPAHYRFSQGSLSVTLDWLCEHKFIDPPTHIKIDVDGIENLVVSGLGRALNSVQSLLIEVNQELKEHQDMINFLTQQGFNYDIQQVKRSERTQGPFRGVAEIVFRRSS
jgi:FkbM family methyltransferase